MATTQVLYVTTANGYAYYEDIEGPGRTPACLRAYRERDIHHQTKVPNPGAEFQWVRNPDWVQPWVGNPYTGGFSVRPLRRDPIGPPATGNVVEIRNDTSLHHRPNPGRGRGDAPSALGSSLHRPQQHPPHQPAPRDPALSQYQNEISQQYRAHPPHAMSSRTRGYHLPPNPPAVWPPQPPAPARSQYEDPPPRKYLPPRPHATTPSASGYHLPPNFPAASPSSLYSPHNQSQPSHALHSAAPYPANIRSLAPPGFSSVVNPTPASRPQDIFELAREIMRLPHDPTIPFPSRQIMRDHRYRDHFDSNGELRLSSPMWDMSLTRDPRVFPGPWWEFVLGYRDSRGEPRRPRWERQQEASEAKRRH